MSSKEQNTNQPLPQGTNISHTENPLQNKAVIRHKQSASRLQKLPLKPKHSIDCEIQQTFRPKNSTQIKKRIKDFSSQQINIQYSYTLPKGGGGIHKETEKGAETLEKK